MYTIDSWIDRDNGVWLMCTCELAVSPERAFEEVATAEGLSAWYTSSSLEPQVGGKLMQFQDALCQDHDTASCGTVTAYGPPTAGEADGEFEWVEEEWMGPDMPVPAWHTRFEIAPVLADADGNHNANSDDESAATAYLTVRSGFTKASKLADSTAIESEQTWRHALYSLAHRLAVFPEGRVRTLQVAGSPNPGSAREIWRKVINAIGLSEDSECGDSFSASGVRGTVIAMDAGAAVLALSEPATGTLNLFAYPDGATAREAAENSSVAVRFTEFVASSAAPEWEAADWEEWLESLGG